MSDILISLAILALFAAAWSVLYQLGGLDWWRDARMAAARQMLNNPKFAFDGEVHVVVIQATAKTSSRNISIRATPTQISQAGLAPA